MTLRYWTIYSSTVLIFLSKNETRNETWLEAYKMRKTWKRKESIICEKKAAIRNYKIWNYGRGKVTRTQKTNANIFREICCVHFQKRCSLFGSCFLSKSLHSSVLSHLSRTLQLYCLRTSSQMKKAGTGLSCCAVLFFFCSFQPQSMFLISWIKWTSVTSLRHSVFKVFF